MKQTLAACALSVYSAEQQKQNNAIFSILVTLKIRLSRQVCRPSAEIADKLVGYLDENFD
jgi:hypothetical protein